MYECVVKHSELSQKCSRKASQLPSHTAQLIISPTEQFLNWFHFFFHTFLQITAVKINQIFFSLVCFHRVRVVLVSDTDSHRLKKRKSKNRRDDSTNKKKRVSHRNLKYPQCHCQVFLSQTYVPFYL